MSIWKVHFRILTALAIGTILICLLYWFYPMLFFGCQKSDGQISYWWTALKVILWSMFITFSLSSSTILKMLERNTSLWLAWFTAYFTGLVFAIATLLYIAPKF